MATVTVSLKDNGGTDNGGVDTSATQTFTIDVTPKNDVPTFTLGGNQTAVEDAGAQTVMGLATDISQGTDNEMGQSLTFNVTSDNDSLFSVQPSIDEFGNLTYTPADNANGMATVTVNLSDDGGTDNEGDRY